jgi:hypothetical protein
MLPQKSMLSLWDSFSALLAANGISTNWLFAGIAIFFIISLLSFREFMCWYLKIYQTQKMIQDLKAEIKDLKTQTVKAPEAILVQEPANDRFVHFN